MANIDMCEHDWPGSGCRECFPRKDKPMPSKLLPLGNDICPKCLSAHPDTMDCTLLPLIPNEPTEALTDAIRAAWLDGAEAVHNAWVIGEGQMVPDFTEAASDYTASVNIDAFRTPASPPAADPALVEELAKEIFELTEVPTIWISGGNSLNQKVARDYARAILPLIAKRDAAQREAAVLAGYRAGIEAGATWLETAAALAGPGPYKSLDVPIRKQCLRDAAEGIREEHDDLHAAAVIAAILKGEAK